MKHSDTSYGSFIMKKIENITQKDIENPENLLFHPEPVFVVNKIPVSSHLALASEMELPVVVILSSKKFDNLPERMMWEKMNIPELPFVCVEWAGDHSNVEYIKTKWRDIVKERQEQIKATLKLEHENKVPLAPNPDAARALGSLMGTIFGNKNNKKDNNNNDNDDDTNEDNGPFFFSL